MPIDQPLHYKHQLPHGIGRACRCGYKPPGRRRNIGAAVGVSSMTGFARAEGEAEGISWIWELKSVNGRALDLRLRLAPGFDILEPQLRAALTQRCRRGNVSASLTVNRVAPPAIRVNRAMLGQIVGLLRELAGELSDTIGAAPPRLAGLIGIPGVIPTVAHDPHPLAH